MFSSISRSVVSRQCHRQVVRRGDAVSVFGWMDDLPQSLFGLSSNHQACAGIYRRLYMVLDVLHINSSIPLLTQSSCIIPTSPSAFFPGVSFHFLKIKMPGFRTFFSFLNVTNNMTTYTQMHHIPYIHSYSYIHTQTPLPK